MFIELYQGLIGLSQDNQLAVSRDNAKRFINWGIRDISQEYDFEFLRGTTTLTASADGLYSLQKFNQPSAITTLYAICQLTADNNTTIEVRGKYISSPTVATASNYQATAITWTASAGATASAATQFNYIDGFTKGLTNGSVFITNGSTVICTLGANDTYVSNDIRKINAIVDGTNQTVNFDWNTQIKANPSNATTGAIAGYDVDYNSQIRVFNNGDSKTYSIYYQRCPKYLIKDNDLTEFPNAFYQDLISYAYNRYALRYQDENDAWSGIQYAEKIKQDIIKKWTMGKDDKDKRITPSWYSRRV